MLSSETRIADELDDTSSTTSATTLKNSRSSNGWAAAAASASSNPLPWDQLGVVLFNRVCDAVAATSIQPYINQRVGELNITGGDKRKVGYYVGLIDSAGQAALTVSVLQWNRLSDYTGRKPILLTGMLGSMLAILCFGFSQTYWGLVASQALWGLLDGNVGITKSMVGELTDSTNRARGFALIFVLWAVGGTIGPIIGGTLANPSERFPGLFTAPFWKRYPYALPCFVVSLFITTGIMLVILFLKETVVSKRHQHHRHRQSEEEEETSYFLQPQPHPHPRHPKPQKPLPLRQVLTYPVFIAVGNYTTLAFIGTAHYSLFPLVFSMPIDIGGLGFDTARIGYILSTYRAVAAAFNALFFPRVVRRYSERYTFILAMSSFPILWALFPVLNICARELGVGKVVWGIIACMVVPVTCMDMAYSCIFIFVTSAAPNRHSLGATNGISQTSASIARSIAPAMATSLFSFSVQHNLLGGYAVHAVLFVLSCLAVLLALRLPHQPRPAWEQVVGDEEDDDDVSEETAIDLREFHREGPSAVMMMQPLDIHR